MEEISLREFGYSTKHVRELRHNALRNAIKARGHNAVVNRLRHVLECNPNEATRCVFAGDLEYLKMIDNDSWVDIDHTIEMNELLLTIEENTKKIAKMYPCFEQELERSIDLCSKIRGYESERAKALSFLEFVKIRLIECKLDPSNINNLIETVLL